MKSAILSPSSISLIAANALLAFGLWQVVILDPAPEIPSLPSVALTATQASAMPSLNKILRRTDPAAARLFGVSPSEAPVEARRVEETSQPEAALRLVGVILTEETDQEHVALIEHGIPAHIVRLRAGSQLNASGWRVRRILPSAVELIRGAERRTLYLD